MLPYIEINFFTLLKFNENELVHEDYD